MYLEIVSPEATIFSGEVDSILVPGVNGEFQMLKDHAPVVSLLKSGTVKIHTHTQSNLVLSELNELISPLAEDEKILTVQINSGAIEVKDNKVIVLAD